MKISKRGEQALRTLMELASAYPSKTLTLKYLSVITGTTIKFLEQIVFLLRRGKFVISQRGNKGGFVLSRDPRKIYLGEVIRFVDGPLSPLANKDDLQALMDKSERYYGLYRTILEVRNAASGILDQCTLWDICEMSREIKESRPRMYYI